MSKTFQPDSLHPYIMDARLKKATGSGGIAEIPIASAETLGGIKVPADSGITIDAEGAISGVPYSTTEHKTGRKWIDGKDIYERIVDYTGALDNAGGIIASNIDYIDNITNAVCVADNVSEGFSPIVVWLDNTELKGRTEANYSSQLLHIVIEYTKPTI